MLYRLQEKAKQALNSLNSRRKKVVHATREITTESRENFEDSIAVPYILNRKRVPKKFHGTVVKARRIYLDLDPDGNLIKAGKKHGGTLVRMWIWYSLFTYSQNLRSDSSLITKVSARGLQAFVIVDMLNVLSEVEFKSK